MDLPPHAHIPGRTPRHAPERFASLHRSVRPGMTAEDLAQSDAWRAGRAYLRHGYYWEAHEVLEPVWLQTAPNSVERHLLRALIQCANAALKLRMDRPRAAHRLCALAEAQLDECRSAGPVMGFDLRALRNRIARLRRIAVRHMEDRAL